MTIGFFLVAFVTSSSATMLSRGRVPHWFLIMFTSRSRALYRLNYCAPSTILPDHLLVLRYILVYQSTCLSYFSLSLTVTLIFTLLSPTFLIRAWRSIPINLKRKVARQVVLKIDWLLLKTELHFRVKGPRQFSRQRTQLFARISWVRYLTFISYSSLTMRRF